MNGLEQLSNTLSNILIADSFIISKDVLNDLTSLRVFFKEHSDFFRKKQSLRGPIPMSNEMRLKVKKELDDILNRWISKNWIVQVNETDKEKDNEIAKRECQKISNIKPLPLAIWRGNSKMSMQCAICMEFHDMKDGIKLSRRRVVSYYSNKTLDTLKKLTWSQIIRKQHSSVEENYSCGHEFGVTCFYKWIKKCEKDGNVVTCPLCKIIV
jgi:hypothetical protein